MTKNDQKVEEKPLQGEPDRKQLRPIFDPSMSTENFPYLKNLRKFILDYPSVTNIALEGDFATGKSTIIQRLLRDDEIKRKKPKVISSLSLMTKTDKTGKTDKEQESDKDKEDSGATSEMVDAVAKNSSVHIVHTPIVNGTPLNYWLQSEIVRLLFYGEKANKLKGFPYKRACRNYIFLPLMLATLSAIGVFLKILNTAISDIDHIDCAYLCIGLVCSTLFGACLYFVFKKIISIAANSGIKHISLRDIEVDLSDEKPDFKQMLDILIEYFRATKRKLIIFEDFDRYGDWKIFEELRNLNLAINSSDYFKKEKDRIIFICATSGKIFNSPSQKNKIFDAIVPVVPFMSASNSSYLFKQELDRLGLESGRPSAIVGIMAGFIDDARVLRSITNRYIEYTQIFNNENKECNNLISLAILAELTPIEFDKLTRNESIIDTVLIKGWEKKNKEINEVASKYAKISQIGNNLTKICTEINRIANTKDSDVLKVRVKDNPYEEITTDAIMAAIDGYSSFILTVRNPYGGTFDREISPDDLRRIVNGVSPLALNQKAAAKRIKEEIKKIVASDSLLVGLSQENMSEYAVEKRLIETGSINQSYIDFVAKSDICPKRDSVSEFINYAIRQRSKKYGYYSPIREYVEEVVSELQDTDYLSPGILNFEMFDYLIRNGELKEDLFNRLASLYEGEVIDFCVSYCEYSTKKYPLTYEENLFVVLFKIIINNNFELALRIIEEAHEKDDRLGAALFGLMITYRKLNNEEIEACSSLSNFSDYIRNGMNVTATDNAINCHLENGTVIEKMVLYNQDSEILQNNISDLKIFLNIENIHEMKNDILNSYISTHIITYGELDDILNYGQVDERSINLILARINLIEGDYYEKAFVNLYNKTKEFNIELPIEQLSIFSGVIDENEIKTIVLERCGDADEVISVLKNSKSIQLRKITSKNKIIKVENSKISVEFAKKLKNLGIVKILKEKNNEYARSEYILLKVLNDN